MYPSRRTVVRFEAGDTIIRHPPQFDVNFSEAPFVRESVRQNSITISSSLPVSVFVLEIFLLTTATSTHRTTGENKHRDSK